jgi:hypothetical protein
MTQTDRRVPLSSLAGTPLVANMPVVKDSPCRVTLTR